MLDTAARSFTPAAAPSRMPDAEPLGAPMPVPGLRPVVATQASTATPTAVDVRHELDEEEGTPSFARHVFGFLLGLLLTPAGLALLGVGLGRLDSVAAMHGAGLAMGDVGLLAGGVAVLMCVALLGAWTPALPVTGGVVWGLTAGAAAMVWPRFTEDLLASMVDDTLAPVDHLAQTATGGDLAVVGALLVAAGLAAGIGRRRGRRCAERAVGGRRGTRATASAGGPAHSRA